MSSRNGNEPGNGEQGKQWKDLEHECRVLLQAGRRGESVFQAGLGDALGAVYLGVYALACVLLRKYGSPNPEDDAQPVVDCFVEKLSGGFPTYDLEKAFAPFGFTVIHYDCINTIRSISRESMNVLPENVRDPKPALLCTTEQAELAAKNARIEARVRRAVLSLVRTQRRAVIARYWLRLGRCDAADICGVKPTTYSGHLFQAELRLRQLLRPEDLRDVVQRLAG